MARVGYHENLVSIIGVITRGHPWVIIVSYCEHGDISQVLRRAAANGEAWWEATKLQMCHEIACGMNHLTVSRIVHRDLAARNVLLTSNKVAKVADFGLSRYIADTEQNTETYYRSVSHTL